MLQASIPREAFCAELLHCLKMIRRQHPFRRCGIGTFAGSAQSTSFEVQHDEGEAPMATTTLTDLGGVLEIPEVISGRVVFNSGHVEIEHGKRYLLVAGDDGKPVISEIPWNAAIASQERYLKMLTEGNGSYISPDVLAQFIDAATAKLERQMARRAQP